MADKCEVFTIGEVPTFGFVLTSDVDFTVLETSYAEVLTTAGVKVGDNREIMISVDTAKSATVIVSVDTSDFVSGHYYVRCIFNIEYTSTDNPTSPFRGKHMSDYYKFFVRDERI